MGSSILKTLRALAPLAGAALFIYFLWAIREVFPIFYILLFGGAIWVLVVNLKHDRVWLWIASGAFIGVVIGLDWATWGAFPMWGRPEWEPDIVIPIVPRPISLPLKWAGIWFVALVALGVLMFVAQSLHNDEKNAVETTQEQWKEAWKSMEDRLKSTDSKEEILREFF
jgi:hypothetical protein